MEKKKKRSDEAKEELDEKTDKIRDFEVYFSFIVQFFSQQEKQKNIFLTLFMYVDRNQE
jgi:hypothetical protein